MTVEVVARRRSHAEAGRGVAAFLRRVAGVCPPGGAARLTVGLVGDRRMRQMNRRWRGKDRTTDVLAFPSGGSLSDPERSLGDVVISVPRARVQARDAGHPLEREIRILALHGYLHLLGHDHETDRGEMLRLQSRLERRLLTPPPAARRNA